MNCNDLLNELYEYVGDGSLPLNLRLRLRLHGFFCPQCAQEIERFELSRDILRNDFLPPAPNFEESVMLRIREEEGAAPPIREIERGVAFSGWVVTGIVLLVSLGSAFFGADFIKTVNFEGNSFLLPVGITIGAALSCYGALFIGSHLEELTRRFGLR
ncbi:MAG: peptidoglycan-binding protein [Treponema sp.]|nr:peptidoglycan-binding protein [Treponema sp.]